MAVISLTYLQTSITNPITASYINLLIAAAQTSLQAQFMTVYLSNPTMAQFESITKVHVPNSNTLL
jgi:hypothetical protein